MRAEKRRRVLSAMVGRNHYRNRGRSNKKGKKRARRSSALNKENAAAAKGRTDLTLKESAAGGWETGSESKNVGGDAGGPPTAVVRPKGCRRIAALAASSRGSLDTTSTDYSSDDVTLSSSECSFPSSSGRRTSARYSSSSTASSSSSGIRSLSARSASTGSYSIGSSSCATPECGDAARGKPQPLRQQNSVTSSEDSYISRTKRKKRRNRKTKKMKVEEKTECDCRSPEECKQDLQPAGAASTRAPAPPRCHRTHEAQDVKIFSRREVEGGSTHTQKQGPALAPGPPTEPHDRKEGLAGKISSGNLIIGGCEENNNRSEHCKEKTDCKKQKDKKRSPRKQKKKSKKVEACETIEIASQFEEGTLSAPKINASLATTKKEVISIEVEGELHYESEESALSSDVQQELVNKGVDGLTHTLKNTVQMLTDRVFETQMSDGGSVTEPTDGGRDHARRDRAMFGAETLVYTVHTPAHVNASLEDSLQQPGHSGSGAVSVQSEKVSSDPSEAVSDNKESEGHNDSVSDETSVSNPSEMSVDRRAIDHPLDRDSGLVEISGASFAAGGDIPEAAKVATNDKVEDSIGSDEAEAVSNETEEANSLEAVSDQAEATSKVEITADFTEDLVGKEEVGGNTDFGIENTEVVADTIETDIISHNDNVDEDEITAGKPDKVLYNDNEKRSEININTGSASSHADHLEVVADNTEVACQVIAKQDAASASDGQPAESRAGNPPSFHTQAAEPAAATTASKTEVAIIRSEDSAAADAAEVESLLSQAAAPDADQFVEGLGWEGRPMKEEARDGGERTTERLERNERDDESLDKEGDTDEGEGEKHLVEEGKRENVEAQNGNSEQPREEASVPKESEEIKKRKRTDIEDDERDEEESDSASDSGEGGRGEGSACILEAGLSARDSARERGGEDKELLTTNMDVISPTEQFEIADYITGRDETEPDIVVFDVKDRNDELVLTGAVRETGDAEEIGAAGENDICDDDGDGDVIVAVKNEPPREDVAIFINDNILSLNPSGTRSIVDVLRSSDEHGEDLVIVDIDDGRGEADEGASTEGGEEEEEEELLLGREGQEGANDRKCGEDRAKEQEKEQVKGMGEQQKYNVEEGDTQVSCKKETEKENVLLKEEVEEMKKEQKIREANFTDSVPGELQVPNVAPTGKKLINVHISPGKNLHVYTLCCTVSVLRKL